MISEAEVRPFMIYNNLLVVAVAILYYDYFMTLSEEISRIWSRPRARSSLLFFIHRYVPLVGYIAVLVYTFGKFPISDQKYTLFHDFLTMFNQTIVAVLLLLRTYAFFGKSRRILTVLSLILIMALSSAFCSHAIPWETQIAFNMTVFILTTVRSYQYRRDFRPLERWSGTLGLAELIVRDGAMYFGVMGLAELANVFTLYDPMRSTLSTFASCISITMMSRLILNLHDTSSLLPSTIQVSRPIVFASMGNNLMQTNNADDDVVHEIELHRFEHSPQEDTNVCE
ncbi:hypothetical protein HETIRDRAFT_119286 [Heterobasidion irregulare TC 32-1]|uniref:DUF6533 domain-containing protein n=1 Tax=Heterobasidion irregulare (strain TC 32-1) TaxID=747525 RepID=W4JR70_HETIT|nr:uncharacterized protein HETIRDRAFT_119286 [Heterobasidion irregulare TC 32-1]ETW76038.1 hypothetical protein HETIRDRAFT_119286 [Heterobasidion irregulare TC 32-1]